MNTDATSRRSVLVATVSGVHAICREHVAIDLVVAGFPASDPGQFVQIRCETRADDVEHESPWPDGGFPVLTGPQWRGRQPYLRRPFSIADQWADEAGTPFLRVISRAVGPGTQCLAGLRAGAPLGLIGPLGRGFRIPPVGVPLVLIGGGVGIPPLLYLTRRLRELGHVDVTVIVGATRGDLLPVTFRAPPPTDGTPHPCLELPGGPYAAVVTTDDGGAGMRGVTTDALVRWHEARGRTARGAVVLACGPEPMLQAVAHLTRVLGLECQLCIERNMGCGLGTCLSCIVRRFDASRPAGWSWALTCADGPVFARDELLDYRAAAPS